jgi:hypothetical protein
MCGSLNPFRSPSPPPPPPEDTTGKAIRQRQREDAAAESKRNKEDLLAQRIKQFRYTMAGGSSLLKGRRGGQGFEVSSNLLSRDTLGA